LHVRANPGFFEWSVTLNADGSPTRALESIPAQIRGLLAPGDGE
jgi:hypothetical protein